MYTIQNQNSYELEIKKSKFISKIFKVYDIEEANNILSHLKTEYNDATHQCYAYIINDHKKSSDDGEPSGTAGTPILQVLEKNNLNYALCVVIRYFGGIKLGAGGLVRAYTKAASNVINASDIVELISGYEVNIIVDYENQKNLESIIKNTIYDKSFDEKVTYRIQCDKDTLDTIKSHNIQYTITKELYIQKKN